MSMLVFCRASLPTAKFRIQIWGNYVEGRWEMVALKKGEATKSEILVSELLSLASTGTGLRRSVENRTIKIPSRMSLYVSWLLISSRFSVILTVRLFLAREYSPSFEILP